MRVLLTGASGFLGSHVLEALYQHNIEVVVLGRSIPKNEFFSDFIYADLFDNSNIAKIVKESSATHLLHLAWYAEHGKFWDSSMNIQWVDATNRLVQEFCKAGGQKVVIAGTCAEYDWSYGFCREDNTPLNPSALYGISKDATRRLTMAICEKYQVSCVWGRIFIPYGEGEASERLIPSLISALQGKSALFGVNSTVYRDFLHASDVAQGFIKLLCNEANGSYNISSGQPIQLLEIVNTLANLLDANPQNILGLISKRTNEPPLLVGDKIKLNALDWKPKLSLEQGLKRVVHKMNNII